MNYKINIKCDIRCDNEEIETRLVDIKNEISNLISLYLTENEKVSFYYKDIDTGTILSYNSDILFYAASSIKILVCVMLLELIEKGDVNIEEKLFVTMEDLKQGSGIIRFQKEDTYYSIKDLIRLTIIESDNTAYIKLVNYVGKEKLERYGKSIGASHTLEGKDLFGLVNCEDMIYYWEKVRNYIVNNSKYSLEFYNWLSSSSFNIIKSSSIDNNNFVKKYGSWGIAYHEAGYVEDEHPFYLIILTQKFKSDNKDEFINETAKKICRIHKLIHNK